MTQTPDPKTTVIGTLEDLKRYHKPYVEDHKRPEMKPERRTCTLCGDPFYSEDELFYSEDELCENCTEGNRVFEGNMAELIR